MRASNRPGFTLVEVMIALTMLAIIMGGVVGVMTSMQRSYIQQREVVRTEDALRVAELTITKILQTAGSNPMNIAAASANRPRIITDLAVPFDTLRVLADFNPVDSAVSSPLEDVTVYALNDTLFVRWQAGALPAPVAFPVRSVVFQYDSAGTVLTTTSGGPQVAGVIPRAATRVRITLEAPRHSRTTVLARRDTWVYIRNNRR